MMTKAVDYRRSKKRRLKRPSLVGPSWRKDVREDGEITLSHRIDIHDDRGRVQLAVPFRACVEIRP
jgi:hypothetical protein